MTAALTESGMVLDQAVSLVEAPGQPRGVGPDVPQLPVVSLLQSAGVPPSKCSPRVQN